MNDLLTTAEILETIAENEACRICSGHRVFLAMLVLEIREKVARDARVRPYGLLEVVR